MKKLNRNQWMKRAVAAAVGLAIIAGVILTMDRGLSRQDQNVYDAAMAYQTRDFGFKGFVISDYAVAFSDGEREYVMKNGEIETRETSLPTLAATAYELEDGTFEVLMPTLDKMSSLTGTMTGFAMEYGETEHMITLLHEGFHCYQLTHYMESIENLVAGDVSEQIVTEQIDTNEEAKGLYTEMLVLLEEMVTTEDEENLLELLSEYENLRTDRNKILPEDLQKLETYYTVVEGSAYYIESQVALQENPEAYKENYIDTIGEYSNGSAKYYHAGMAEASVLDRLNPEWKESYDFSMPLSELLAKELR